MFLAKSIAKFREVQPALPTRATLIRPKQCPLLDLFFLYDP
jgi:hypothetical protein